MTRNRIQLTPEMDSVLDQLSEARPAGPTKEQALKRAQVVLDYLDRQDNTQQQAI